MATTSQSRGSSSDLIVRDIMRGLYDGRFVAGQRLVEPDLMTIYAVSRGTVREALQRLAAEGIVSQTAFRGAHIRHLSKPEAREILQLLEVNVGLAARLAAENIDRLGQRPEFIAAYEDLLRFADRPDSYDMIGARNAFYRAMINAGGNVELGRLIRSFRIHLIRTYLRQPSFERFAHYEQMVSAILDGNAEAAEAAGRAHIRSSLERLDDIPETVFAAPALERLSPQE